MSVDDLDLLAALGRLPLRYREVLVLHYLADLPVQEIAAELRVPQGTVSSAPVPGPVRFEDGTALRAGPDGSFTTTFEIPPGPTGDFFLDATCGGATREVKLRREP
jgi:hypothetical protein